MEAGQPLCLPCARLDDLEYLPAGDASLRAAKSSDRTAVVERQGILVENSALEKAEQERLLDADERAKARAVGALRRKEQECGLIAKMTEEIGILFPRCPPNEEAAIAVHTAARGSGWVGRTAAGRNLEERALTAAVTAAVRHEHTGYDALLATGVKRDLARQRVAGQVRAILPAWRKAIQKLCVALSIRLLVSD